MQREEREIPMGGCFLGAPYRGLGPQPRHVPQTGNRTGNLLIHRPTLNPLSHTSQAEPIIFPGNTFTWVPSIFSHLVNMLFILLIAVVLCRR